MQHLLDEADWQDAGLEPLKKGRLGAGAGSRYLRSRQMADALLLLKAQIARPGHAFWPDDAMSIDSEAFDHRYLLGPKQITDAYLLALAVRNNGRLVTFDRAIPLAAVHGARQERLVAL